MTRAAWWMTAAVMLSLASADAWHGPGHDLATRAAVRALPATMPEFFRTGADRIAHCAVDPDTFTRPIGPPDLHQAEAPEHYFDLEPVAELKLPTSRYAFLEMVYQRKLKPQRVGLLPYAVCEWTERLTVALAEHRRWPDDPAIRHKVLVYAGILAHYGEDLCQPLHTTVHYDGRLNPDGSSPKTGIHLKLDALLGKLRVELAEPPAAPAPAPLDPLMPAVLAELKRSHALVDRVYELAKELPAYEAPLDDGSPAADFARDRLRACARFVASLYLTAWADSAKVRFPDWHHRPPVTPDRLAAPATQPG